MDLPKTFDEFVDARKQGFIRAKEFKDNGGKLAGCLCSYTPQELLDAAGVATVGLCGTSSETIPDAEKVLPKNLCPLIKSTYGFAYSEKCPYTYFSDIIDLLINIKSKGSLLKGDHHFRSLHGWRYQFLQMIHI